MFLSLHRNINDIIFPSIVRLTPLYITVSKTVIIANKSTKLFNPHKMSKLDSKCHKGSTCWTVNIYWVTNLSANAIEKSILVS